MTVAKPWRDAKWPHEHQRERGPCHWRLGPAVHPLVPLGWRVNALPPRLGRSGGGMGCVCEIRARGRRVRRWSTRLGPSDTAKRARLGATALSARPPPPRRRPGLARPQLGGMRGARRRGSGGGRRRNDATRHRPPSSSRPFFPQPTRPTTPPPPAGRPRPGRRRRHPGLRQAPPRRHPPLSEAHGAAGGALLAHAVQSVRSNVLPAQADGEREWGVCVCVCACVCVCVSRERE